ncbi:MAG: hypothetical protein RLN85_02410, partial [Pseudomonadales bacterium]
MRMGVVLMGIQNLAMQGMSAKLTDALRTHKRCFAHIAYSTLEISYKLRNGCTQATFTSPTRRIGTEFRPFYVYEDTRDRRYTCRTASRASSPS